jgi:hypothetical protein
MLEAPRKPVHNDAVNIERQGNHVQARDIAEMACDAVPGPTVSLAHSAGPDLRNYRVERPERSALSPVVWPTLSGGGASESNNFRRAGFGLSGVSTAGQLIPASRDHLDVSVVVCGYTEQCGTRPGAALASVLGQHPRPAHLPLVVDHTAGSTAQAGTTYPRPAPRGRRLPIRVIPAAVVRKEQAHAGSNPHGRTRPKNGATDKDLS